MALPVDCYDIELLYDAYFHNVLPPDIKQGFALHLKNCDSCQGEVDKYAMEFELRWDLFQAQHGIVEGHDLLSPDEHESHP